MRRHAGRTLLTVVGVYGITIVVFGLSHRMWLSLLALAVGGGVDMVSVVLRQTILPLVTPDELRGRVTAVEMVFISASNELGAFESGVAAALVGAVPAVIAGGVAHDRDRGRLDALLPGARGRRPARRAAAVLRVAGPDEPRLESGDDRLRAVAGSSVERLPSLPAGTPLIDASTISIGWRAGSGCSARRSAVATWTRQPGFALA